MRLKGKADRLHVVCCNVLIAVKSLHVCLLCSYNCNVVHILCKFLDFVAIF